MARYHSLFANESDFPSKDLAVLARTAEGVVMAVQHKVYPIAAVQFHPESILTLPKYGMKIINNAINNLSTDAYN